MTSLEEKLFQWNFELQLQFLLDKKVSYEKKIRHNVVSHLSTIRMFPVKLKSFNEDEPHD